MLFQGLNELSQVAFGDIPAHFEFLADFIDDCRFGRPGFKELENARTDEVKVEHLALPDIQNDGTVLSVCAANSFGHSVHRFAPLGTVGCSKCVSHTLTLGAVETPVILESVRERISLLALGPPRQ